MALGDFTDIDIPENAASPPPPVPPPNWKDRLTWADASNKLRKKASFRGATFFVRGTGYSVGRRNVVHQYPDRDEPFVEDMGLDAEDFRIEGYVIQNLDNNYDYFTERDALIKALKEFGPGTLIHPFYGTLIVSLIGKASIDESFHGGGMARFRMSFVRAEKTKAPYPKPILDHVKAVDDAVEDSLDSGVDGFGAIYDGEDVAGFSAESALAAVGELNTMMRSAISAIQGAGPAQISKALTALSEQYSAINLTTIADTCGLANDLIGMSNGLLSLFGQYGEIVVSQLFGACSSAVRGISSGPMSGAQVDWPSTDGFEGSTMSDPAVVAEDYGKTVTRSSLAMARYGEDLGNDDPSPYGGELESITISTSSRAREAANQVAMVNMARLTAITTACKSAIRIEFTSHDSVIEIMEELIEAIDAQLLKLGNDAANEDFATYNITVADPNNYQALQSLRPVIVESMLGIGAPLADIVEYKVPPATMPALILAYDRYEDLDREKEIITRNRPLIKHPGFMPGGQTVEILSE